MMLRSVAALARVTMLSRRNSSTAATPRTGVQASYRGMSHADSTVSKRAPDWPNPKVVADLSVFVRTRLGCPSTSCVRLVCDAARRRQEMSRQVLRPVRVWTDDRGRPARFVWREVTYSERVVNSWKLSDRWWD